jgi:hypothetical protein
MISKAFVQKLLAKRADSYLLVFSYLWSYSDDKGYVEVPLQLLCTYYEVSRPTMYRILQFGVEAGVCRVVVSKKMLKVYFDKGATEVSEKVKRKKPIKNVENAELYQRFLRIYKAWILDTASVDFKPVAMDNAAIHGIINKLKEGHRAKAPDATEEALNDGAAKTFETILRLWSVQPAFYQTKVKLPELNNHLVVLIKNIKQQYETQKTNRQSAFERANAALHNRDSVDSVD